MIPSILLGATDGRAFWLRDRKPSWSWSGLILLFSSHGAIVRRRYCRPIGFSLRSLDCSCAKCIRKHSPQAVSSAVRPAGRRARKGSGERIVISCSSSASFQAVAQPRQPSFSPNHQTADSRFRRWRPARYRCRQRNGETAASAASERDREGAIALGSHLLRVHHRTRELAEGDKAQCFPGWRNHPRIVVLRRCQHPDGLFDGRS